MKDKPWEAVGLYSVIVGATLLGIGIDFSPPDPIKALFWSAVINSVVAVPAMVAMMWMAGGRDQMGSATPAVLVFGWAATAVIKGATDNLGSRTV